VGRGREVDQISEKKEKDTKTPGFDDKTKEKARKQQGGGGGGGVGGGGELNLLLVKTPTRQKVEKIRVVATREKVERRDYRKKTGGEKGKDPSKNRHESPQKYYPPAPSNVQKPDQAKSEWTKERKRGEERGEIPLFSKLTS